MVAELDRLTRDYFEDDPEPTHLDYAEAIVASGGTIQALAERISGGVGFDVSRESLRRHLYSVDPDNAFGRLARAREEGAHAQAEQSNGIADSVMPEAGEVAKARLRVATRQWNAERANPAVFASKGSAMMHLTLNVGQLHLDALRARTARPSSAIATVDSPALPPAGPAEQGNHSAID